MYTILPNTLNSAKQESKGYPVIKEY